MTEVLTLNHAIKRVESERSKHILLGNGFSRACRNDIFSYGKLFERANFSKLSQYAQNAFPSLKTTDFEVVMEALKRAATLIRLYSPRNKTLPLLFEKDANGMREVLVSAIAQSHPARPSDIEQTKYESCKRFLANFKDIYTLNYDLLLYWTLMQDEIQPAISCDDGFRLPESGPTDWVTWNCSAHDQNVHYLHGGLHVYEAGPEIQKYTWCNTGKALIDQIRAALQAEKYPLFVAEGTSDQKMARIIRSSFLGRAYRSFENIGGVLFTYGLSFGDSDDHIVRAIAQNKVKCLVVSMFGDPQSKTNAAIASKLSLLQQTRVNQHSKRALDVVYYDAASANVWG